MVDRYEIIFHKGLYEETLKINSDIAFAHIDCDWYESVMICLQNLVPNLVKGAVLVIDDYFHYQGCKDAVDEYFKGKSGYVFKEYARLHITKVE